MNNWISVKTRLPMDDTPVLACVVGYDTPLVLEIRVETCNPMVESYFKDFRYWDDPNNDGQDYEDCVFAWMDLPDMPTKEEIE